MKDFRVSSRELTDKEFNRLVDECVSDILCRIVLNVSKYEVELIDAHVQAALRDMFVLEG